jgi:Na+-translocating ferredoxin:NAD+ oxidoreductase subunit G
MVKRKTYHRKNAVTLLLLSAFMIAILFTVYHLLKDTIVKADKNSELELIRSVLPEFDNNPLDSAVTYEDLIFYTAKKGDSIVGYACRTFSEKGFNGRFTLLAGFLPDGTIYKSIVLGQNETPGFGSRIRTSWNEQFERKKPTEYSLKVKKDGGDVDAITGATISSRAYCDAIEKAYISLMKNVLKTEFNIAGSNNDNWNISDINILKKVLPVFDNDPLKDTLSIGAIEFYFAKKKDDTIGYAVKSSATGYNGSLWILTGILPDGKIYNTTVLKNNESVGYGSKVSEPEFLSQFKGKDISKIKFEVKKDGGDVDAVSGATISSRAFCEALALACSTYSDNIKSKGKTDTKKDSVVAPSIPQVYQFADKSIFNGVLPAFDNDPLKDFKSVDGLDLYFGKSGGSTTGIAVTTFSDKGYGGKIILLVGFTASGSINNISVIVQNETAYMGTQITESDFKDQFNGKNPATYKLQVKDDGGDVDAISGSTISSRAFCDAVQKAYAAFLKGK